MLSRKAESVWSQVRLEFFQLVAVITAESRTDTKVTVHVRNAMPYRKRGASYLRKGKRYSLKQVQAIHFAKLRRRRGKKK